MHGTLLSQRSSQKRQDQPSPLLAIAMPLNESRILRISFHQNEPCNFADEGREPLE